MKRLIVLLLALTFILGSLAACKKDKGSDKSTTEGAGTPFCVTIDHDSLNDRCVTIRHRDSMQQERVKIEDLHAIISKEVNLSNILKKLA